MNLFTITFRSKMHFRFYSANGKMPFLNESIKILVKDFFDYKGNFYNAIVYYLDAFFSIFSSFLFINTELQRYFYFWVFLHFVYIKIVYALEPVLLSYLLCTFWLFILVSFCNLLSRGFEFFYAYILHTFTPFQNKITFLALSESL